MLIVRCNELPFEEVGGELVILDVKNDVFFNSNVVGMTIWKNIEEPVLISDLYAMIADIYTDISYENIVLDIDDFIQCLLKNNLAKKFNQ